MENSEADHSSDIIIGEREFKILGRVVAHLQRVHATVGYGCHCRDGVCGNA